MVANDFRAGTLAEYCFDIPLSLTAPDTVSDAILTATIARKSVEFDEYTGDHFETQAAVVLTLDGSGTRQQYLPRRTTAVTLVRTRDNLGNYTSQASTAYRLHSSLDSTGATRLFEYDFLEIPLYQYLAGIATQWGGFYWPTDAQSVEVTGTFGWTLTPAKVKRAVALMTYDHLKPMRQDLRRVDRFNTADASFTMATTSPTGIPEVDSIVADFTRDAKLAVA